MFSPFSIHSKFYFFCLVWLYEIGILSQTSSLLRSSSFPGLSVKILMNYVCAQSCLTFCNPMDYSLLGSSVPGILQARILEWVAISLSNTWKWKMKLNSPSRAVWVMSNSLWPHGLQHVRLACSSPSPGVCSNSCPLSRWCYLTISSSAVPLSFCPQSFQHQGL